MTISGAMDAGYGRSTTNNDASAVTTIAKPRNNITFSGTEDLGGGMKAFFGAQQRFSPADGTTAYHTPMEQVWMGLSGNFGTLKAGRFTGVFSGPENNFDVWGTDSSGAGLSTAASRARFNGQVAYYSPSFNGVTVSAQYNPKANNSEYSAVQNGTDFAVSYAAGAVKADVIYRNDVNKDKLTGVDGSYDLGVAKLSAGYVKNDVYNSTSDTKEYSVQASMPMGAMVLSAGYRSLQTNGAADLNRTALRAQYNLSKRTAVIGDIYTDSKTGTTYQTGYYAGLRHTF